VTLHSASFLTKTYGQGLKSGSNEELIIKYISLGGTRNAGKPALFVWSRGKAGDNFKCLPIANDCCIVVFQKRIQGNEFKKLY